MNMIEMAEIEAGVLPMIFIIQLVDGRSPEEVEGPAGFMGGPPGCVVSHTMDPSSATVDSFKARVTLLNNNWCLKLFFILFVGGTLRPAHINSKTKFNNIEQK